MSTRWSSIVTLAALVLAVAAAPALAAELHLDADTYTVTLTPTTNFGAAPGIRVQGPPNAQSSFLRFDLSALPPSVTGSDVAQATLRLWVNQVGTRGDIVVHEVLAAWSELGLTHARAPALGNVVATGAVGKARSFVTIDVTTLVRDWVDGTLANRGLALVAGGAGVAATFDSKENEATSHDARLEIALSGVPGMSGDITRVMSGPGLNGGATSGDVVLSVAPSFRLPQACATDQVPKATGTGTWVCAADGNSGGDVTSVIAGAGLSGGGVGGDVTVAVAPGYQLPQACGANQVARADGAGGWACAADITGVTAGTGIAGGGTGGAVSVAVASSYRLPQACTANQVAKSNGAGGWTCSANVSALTVSPPLAASAGSAPNVTLPHVTIDAFNTGIGTSTLAASPTGQLNVAAGVRALQATTLGENNTAAGAKALQANTEGNDNTGAGMRALAANTTGVGNTAVGATALAANTTGGDNVAVGVGALGANTTGTGNIAVGVGAGGAQTTGSNNIYVGADAVNLENDTIRIGDASTRAFMGGIWGVTTANDDAIAVVVDSDGQLGTTISTRRAKTAVADMGAVSQRLHQLRPVTFQYVDRAKVQFGLIAEEVAQVLPELVAYGKDGQPLTVLYHALPSLLLNELQRQAREIEALKAELRGLIEAARAAASAARLAPAPGVR